MSVPEGKRNQGRLEVFIDAQNMAIWTLNKVGNKKLFPGRYQKVIDRIVDNAWGIAEDIWTANNIYVGSGADRRNIEDRKYLQNRAVVRCNALLFDIQMAKALFELPTKTITYWGGLVTNVRDKVKAWRDSDAKRLSNHGTRL